MTYVKLHNEVEIVGVLAGYTLSFIKEEALQIKTIKVSRGGSQFRSRNVFPNAAAAIAEGDYSLLGAEIASSEILNLPTNRVAWTDGYGNIKTTIPASSVNLPLSSKVTVRVGDVVSDAVYSDGSFRVPEGTLAFAPGSSGWQKKNGQKVTWMELFLRGGNAWSRFGKPKINQTVTYTKLELL